MFCKASVLKCSGLKEKAAYSFACRVIPFLNSGNLQFYFVHLLTPLPPKTNETTKRKNVACWLKLEQSALKH